MNTLIFTATFNEVDNIEFWYQSVKKFAPKSKILIIDDSSTDGTNSKINLLQKFDKNLVLITRPKKSGLGSAHITAWRYAYENQFDQLITMDADLSHDATSINDISNMLLSCDFVIGTRFNLGKTEYKFVRKYLSVMANKLCRILLPSNLTEYTTSYRGFNLKTLEYLLQKEKWSENYSFFIEVIEYLNYSNLKLREVPINFRKRNSGKTKIPSNQIVLTMFKLLELFLNRKRNFTK